MTWESSKANQDTKKTDGPQVRHAAARALLLRQRDDGGFHPPPVAHLLPDQVHPPPEGAPFRRPSLHQQAIDVVRLARPPAPRTSS